jgi:hypothetical protein
MIQRPIHGFEEALAGPTCRMTFGEALGNNFSSDTGRRQTFGYLAK